MDGRHAPDRREALDVFNPATGKPVGAIARGNAAAVDEAVRSADKAFRQPSWRRAPLADRGRLLMKVADIIKARADELAKIESLDVGKPITQASADVRTAARYFEYFAGMADKVHGEYIPIRWGAVDIAQRQPYGVSAQIIPWNFPLAMGARGIAPSLAAGNAIVAKPSELASQSILRLAEIITEAGAPPGLFNVVTGLGVEAGAALAEHPLVQHITFTGSVATGESIMRAAAVGSRPVALELGGKSPAVVFHDADLGAAAAMIVNSFTYNAGQTCNACTRLLVDRRVAEDLLARVRKLLDAMTMGDPMDDPRLGPLISAPQRGRVERFLQSAKESGADISMHCALPDAPTLRDGYFLRPAVVSHVAPDHPAHQDEVFGPVLAVAQFSDDDEAVALANGTRYGLVASVWTRDVARAMSVSQQIDAGQVYINGWGTGGSVEVPFGGYKASGVGREKGLEGLLHYTQVRTITIHH